ncbi:glycosyltransferase [Silvibacterium acidisoli]|uniref:glycosyltransferase n=1 Tax=Acidobacteriaceae bacterium ZG23-2 TaxID=2883246 RepID=UPI00406CA55F
MTQRRVLLFRSELLPRSEAFLVEQSRAMRIFQAVFAGIKRLPESLDFQHATSRVLSEGASLRAKIRRRVFAETRYAPHFMDALVETRSQLLHAHFAVDAALALPIQRRLNVPMIVTLHGYDVTRDDSHMKRTAAGRIYLRRRQELWGSARLFLCVSEYIRRRAIERGFPEEKLRVHSIGVDLEKFRPGIRSLQAEPIVLFAGRLVENKGCSFLLRAMQQVEQRHPDARLVVIGDGPLRRALEEEARQRLRRYTFTGMQTHRQVRDWMGRASMLVMPSLQVASGDAEGLGMVMCEAQAVGLPGVGFRGTGVEEALDHGRSGLLVNSGDSDSLAVAILNLLRDARLRQSLSTAGRDHAERRFNLYRQTALLEDIYCDLLASS